MPPQPRRTPVSARRSTPGSAFDESLIPTPPIRFDDDEPRSATKAKADIRNSAKAKRKSGGGFMSFLVGFAARVALFYVLIGALYICPKETDYLGTSASRPLCRSLNAVETRLEPLARPVLNRAHEAIRPYTDPYLPYVHASWKMASPHVCRAGKLGSWALHSAHTASKPYVDAASVHAYQIADPYVHAAMLRYEQAMQVGRDKYDRSLRPYLSVAQERYKKELHPHLSLAYERAQPVLSSAYSNGIWAAKTGYDTSSRIYVSQVHPRLIQGGKAAVRFFYNTVLPALHRLYSLYVEPQWEKLVERLYEYRVGKVEAQSWKEARNEAKRLKQEVEAHQAQAINEARESAIAAEEDQSVMGKMRKLKDSVIGDKQAEDAKYDQDKPASGEESEAERAGRIAAKKAEAAEKRRVVMSQLEAYEQALGPLIDKERSFLVERLAELRARAVEDLPARFTAAFTGVQRDTVKAIQKLEDYFDRSAKDETKSLEEKIGEADKVVEDARAKLKKAVDELAKELDAYEQEHETKERQAVGASKDAIERFVDKAQADMGHKMAWTDEITYKDWQQYHHLRDMQNEYVDEAIAIQQGNKSATSTNGVDIAQSADVGLSLEELDAQHEKLLKDIERELDGAKKEGLKVLKAQKPVLQVVKDSAEVAAAMAADLGSNAKEDVEEFIGISSEPQGVRSSVESVYSVASSVASEAAQVASSSLQQATRSAASAVGATPSPDGVGEQAESAYNRGAETVDSVSSQLSSVIAPSSSTGYIERATLAAADAAAQVSSAVDVPTSSTPSSEGVTEHGASVAARAESYAEEGASAASSAVREGVGAATPGSVERATSAVMDATDSASSLSHEASRTVISLAGATPTPDTPLETLSSLAAEGQESVKSMAQAASRSAASVLEGGVDASEEDEDEDDSILESEPGTAFVEEVKKVEQVVSRSSEHDEL